MSVPKIQPVYAWAAVGKTGKVLRWKGRYAIYTHKADAADDCPRYGQVRRVRISVQAAKK